MPPSDQPYPQRVSVANVNDDAIAAALSKLVDDGIEAGAFVILEPEASDGSNYYIQFAFDSDRLFCEAVSNEYLEPPYELDDEQMRTLDENLRWRPPEHEGQNWFRTFRPTSPEDYDEIVALVHRAWREVYRLPEETPITMIVSWEGQTIPFDSEIRFASEGHRSTYERIARYAAELFGDMASFEPRRPVLFVQHGSAIVSVAVNPLKIHSSVVTCYSWVVTEPRLTQDLRHYLLTTNYRLALGGFALDGDGDVVLKHVLLGDRLTEYEFKTALITIADLADEYDDEIVERFGGLRASGPHRAADGLHAAEPGHSSVVHTPHMPHLSTARVRQIAPLPFD